MTALHHALRLAEAGIPVFACAADKRPVTQHGFRDATTDLAKLRAMFTAPGAVLVAVPTGESSGVVVLDGDVTAEADGRATLRQWTVEGRLPWTRVHETRRGGVHLLFRRDPARPIRCSQGKLAPLVDVRGVGGYVVWWPGSGGVVLSGVPIGDLPELPAWVSDALAPAREPAAEAPQRPRSGHPDATEKRLEAVIKAAAQASEGSRNSLLFWASKRCAEMVAEGSLAAEAAKAALVEAGKHAGLSEREAKATVVSGLGDGGTHGR
jgi:hypothetical protein